jgi:glutathione S-transferase
MADAASLILFQTQKEGPMATTSLLQLYSSPASPFGRKILLAAHCLGLADRLQVIHSDTNDPQDANRRLNPLGKIPTLQTPDGVLYDSRVILNFLDRQAPGQLFSLDAAARLKTETEAALADGIMDAAILIVYESRFRPETHFVEDFVEYQRDKIRRALHSVEASQPAYGRAAQPDAGQIGLACALDYLDLRGQLDWRAEAPSLTGWMAGFAADVPGYHATLPPGIPPAPWH